MFLLSWIIRTEQIQTRILRNENTLIQRLTEYSFESNITSK
jgi:hypothetical protein